MARSTPAAKLDREIKAALLPRYNPKRGWVGGDSRTLYTFTDEVTNRIAVHPGAGGANKPLAMHMGPSADVRIATREEAEMLWQNPLKPGWTVSDARMHHLDRRWTKARLEARRELEALGAVPDVEMDPLVRASIARDAYESCQKERSKEVLAGIPPIVLGKTKYRVIYGNERSLDLIGPRGGSSALVRSTNDPNAWAHNTGSGYSFKTVWYRRNPDHTFTRVS